MSIQTTSIRTTVWKTMQKRKQIFFVIKTHQELQYLITTTLGRVVLGWRRMGRLGLPVLNVVEVLRATLALSNPFASLRLQWYGDTTWKTSCSLQQRPIC